MQCGICCACFDFSEHTYVKSWSGPLEPGTWPLASCPFFEHGVNLYLSFTLGVDTWQQAPGPWHLAPYQFSAHSCHFLNRSYLEWTLGSAA